MSPLTLENGPELQPKLLVSLDNDSKHYHRKTLNLLDDNEIGLLASLRRKQDGTCSDTVRGPGGHMRTCYDERFPTFSPDFNMPIEKLWRQMDRQIKHGTRI